MPSSRLRLAAAAVCLALAGTGAGIAHAAGSRVAVLRMTVERPHFTCEGHGLLLSHVAYHHDPKPVLPCCDGQIGCAQFLSTNSVLHPVHRWHS